MAYTRRRSAWKDWPDTSTPARAADYAAWEDALYQLKQLSLDVVSDFGAADDGVTDDGPAINSAVAAAISGGYKRIFLGTNHNIATPIDASALKGTNKGLIVEGRAGGDVTGSPGFHGATVLLNATGQACITANGDSSTNSPIIGLSLRRFAIKNTTDLGSAYTIDLDYCVGDTTLEDVFVYGNGKTGSGIAYRNMAKGNAEWRNVRVREFKTGVGFRISCESTGHVGTAINSGNSVFAGCEAFNCLTGWYLLGDGNELNSHSLVSCKAVNNADIVGSVGYHIGNGATGRSACHTLVSPHAERCSTGILVDGGSRHNLILSPMCNYLSGTPDANSAAVRIGGTAVGNEARNIRVRSLHYGCSFESSAQSNFASADDESGSRALTSVFSDTTAAGRNMTVKQEDTAANPAWAFNAYDVTFNGKLGFYGAGAAAKPTVTGAKGSNAALGSLLSALATLGLLTDSSSA